jgi:hypothetical protein
MMSANSPEVLEKYQIGTIFGTKFDGNQLRMFAYVDRQLVANVGEKAEKAVAQIEESGTIEISVGCFLDAEESEGVYEGKPYKRVWRNIVPDHLAFLEEGSIGACSNQAGCGAGISRAAIHVVTKEGFTLEGETMADIKEDDKIVPRSLRERLKDMVLPFRINKSVEDMSDADLRRALDKALRSTEPAYLGVESVFPADNLVIFSCMPDDQWLTFSRSYTVSKDGKVSFEGKRSEVEPVTRFEPVAAEAAPVAASCGCGGHANVSAEGAEGGGTVHKNAERITALIASPKSHWSEVDREYLQTQTDERLAALEALIKPEPVAAAAAPAPVVEKTEPKLEELPAAWQAAIRSAQDLEKNTRSTLVEKLTAAQDAFSADDLKSMSFDQLQKLGKAVLKASGAELVDFAAAAGTRRAPIVEDDFADEAPDLGAAVRTARGIQ